MEEHQKIREKIIDRPGSFRHFISLGYSCYVAWNLQDLGLRSESMPFDWAASSLDGVRRAIQTDFQDFLAYDNLYQDKKHHHAYQDASYGFDFYHDFKKELPLRWQLPAVKRKYRRRIKRFFRRIKEPTLFIRYIRNEDELLWLAEHHGEIESLLKGFCAGNEILYISDIDGSESFDRKIPGLFHVKKDDGEKLTKRPITGNPILNAALSSFDYADREKNLAFYANRKPNTSLKYRLMKKIREIRKDYTHKKQKNI